MRHDRHYVDELNQRMEDGIGRMLPVSSITSNQDQPRSALGDLDDLVQSISRHGILEPLLVRRAPAAEQPEDVVHELLDPEAPATRQIRYVLVSGERRFHAALEAGLEEVPCIELEVSEGHALEIALIENLQRKDLSAFEEAEGFHTLQSKYSYTHDQIAAAVGRSRVTITETLTLLSMPESVRQQCRHADIAAKGLLLEIAKAPDTASMERLVEEIASGKLDRAALRERRKELTEEAEAAAGRAGAPESPAAGEEQSEDEAAQGPRRPRRRPVVMRFHGPKKRFSLALSFKSETQPEPEEIISVLEDMIRRLREDGLAAAAEADDASAGDSESGSTGGATQGASAAASAKRQSVAV
jgi:ParB family chromosome partitioning protein